MTNFEKLISDKEAIAHIINDKDHSLYQIITKWYCENKCESKLCLMKKDYCVGTLSSEEMIDLWLEAEYEK